MSDKTRQTIYNISTIVAGLVSLLMVRGVIEATTAESLLDLITAAASVFVTGGVGTAAVVLKKQRNEGVLEPSVERTAADSLQAVSDRFNNVVTDVVSGIEKVQAAANGLAASVPVQTATPLGPLADQVLRTVREETDRTF